MYILWGPGPCPEAALLFLDCSSFVSAFPPFPDKQLFDFALWNSRKVKGAEWSLFPTNKKWGDTESICTWEGPIGSCSVSTWWSCTLCMCILVFNKASGGSLPISGVLFQHCSLLFFFLKTIFFPLLPPSLWNSISEVPAISASLNTNFFPQLLNSVRLCLGFFCLLHGLQCASRQKAGATLEFTLFAFSLGSHGLCCLFNIWKHLFHIFCPVSSCWGGRVNIVFVPPLPPEMYKIWKIFYYLLLVHVLLSFSFLFRKYS